MDYKELTEILQAQNIDLMITIKSMQDLHVQTIESLTSTIKSLSVEVSELKGILLEKDKNKEKMESKLNGLLKINLPKTTEKRSTVDNTLKSNKPALTPKERGNNGSA